jgi:hypothetical protein
MGFRPGLGVTGRAQIGGQEDAEIQERLWRSGRVGLYLPHLVTQHRAHGNRLTQAYHFRWHRGHGRFTALRRMDDVERSRAHLFGVPSHLYRSGVEGLLGWVGAMLRGDELHAMDCRIRFVWFQGFFTVRYAEWRASRPQGILREMRQFVESLIRTRGATLKRESSTEAAGAAVMSE